MHDCGQEFIQVMLGHITFLFEDRTSASASNYVDEHVELCRCALGILLRLGRVRGSELTVHTWERLLRLLIGITDNLLHGSKSVLAPRICSEIYRVTIELFIRSLTKCGQMGDLWKILTKFSKRWVHRHQVLDQWNSIILALTKRMMQSLYTPNSAAAKEKVFKVTWADQYISNFEYVVPRANWLNSLNIYCRLPGTMMSYVWYRMVNVLGHPNHMNDPEVHALAIVSTIAYLIPSIIVG